MQGTAVSDDDGVSVRRQGADLGEVLDREGRERRQQVEIPQSHDEAGGESAAAVGRGRDVVCARVQVVDAFFAAAHGGDFDALVAALDPDVVSRIDAGAGALIPSGVLHGAATVARQTLAIASIVDPERLRQFDFSVLGS